LKKPPRTIADILLWPKTDAEERIFDAHVRRECEAIQRTWSPLVRLQRRAGWDGERRLTALWGWRPPEVSTPGADADRDDDDSEQPCSS
jgi:hypothetical protein